MFEEPHGLAHTPTHIAFDGANGALLEIRGGDLKPAAKTISTLIGLRVAHFADTGLRLLFFLCGVMGSAMVATGLVLWSLARLPKAEAQPYLGLRLVQALNIGSIAGLPAAIAVYFLANRLLPLGLADRAEWEIRAFFGAWIVAALIPLARPHRRAWSEMLVLVSGLCLAVVAVDIAMVEAHPLRRLGEGEALFLWFDGAMLALAALFAFAARRVVRYRGPSRDERRREPVLAAPAERARA